MVGAEISILEETSEVALSSLLKGEESSRLEAKLTVDTVADGSDESLEGGLSEHEGGGLLVALDLSDGNGAGSESSLLLHATFSWGCLLLGLVNLASLGAGDNTGLGGGSLNLLLSGNLLSGHFLQQRSDLLDS